MAMVLDYLKQELILILSLSEGHVEVLHHDNTAFREVVEDSGKCHQVPSETLGYDSPGESGRNQKLLTTSRTSTRHTVLA